MANPLFGMFGNQMSGGFGNFLNSGKMSQSQFNQLQAMATQFQNMMGRR